MLLGTLVCEVGVKAQTAVVARAVWVPPDGVEVGWSATAGRSYRLESVGDLSEAWNPHATDPAVLVASGEWLAVAVPMDGGRRFFRVVELAEQEAPSGMVLIPAGTFQMGDPFAEADSDERPVHTVTVSAFYMDQFEVTKALWDEVRTWGWAHGYTFANPGRAKAGNHPVQSVSWPEVVKWCNARSERDGRVPAYYTSAAQTTVYRTWNSDPQNGWVKWDAGYRLPTEAEWEYAARGGLTGKRFPWGETISHSEANYMSSSVYGYDVSSTQGYHPTYAAGGEPYTSPVGSFAANGYGLYDMAGNVWEWCWDRYGDYTAAAAIDPRGPAAGALRVFRGGSWHYVAWYCRVADRYFGWPAGGYDGFGFRAVLPSGKQ